MYSIFAARRGSRFRPVEAIFKGSDEVFGLADTYLFGGIGGLCFLYPSADTKCLPRLNKLWTAACALRKRCA